VEHEDNEEEEAAWFKCRPLIAEAAMDLHGWGFKKIHKKNDDDIFPRGWSDGAARTTTLPSGPGEDMALHHKKYRG
jgi:hypothetical protein